MKYEIPEDKLLEIMHLLGRLDEEATYQIEEAPFVHNEDALASWQDDQSRSVEMLAYLSAISESRT